MNNNAQNDNSSKIQPFVIFIESLDGSVFEVTIYPKDDVLSIKMKIEELKGIPVSQQQLLYNFKELDNKSTIEENIISNKVTLQLILSVQSGPVSTMRKIIPLSSVTLKGFLNSNRKELGSIQPGTKLAFMVFRDGTKVKMFRMLEKLDSTVIVEPILGSSVRNSSSKQQYTKNHKVSKSHEDPKIYQKMKVLKTALLEQKNTRKKEISSENQSSLSTHVLNESKLPCKKKLPPLSPLINTKEDSNRRPKIEFTHVPVLPNIGPSASVSSSRETSFLEGKKLNESRCNSNKLDGILNDIFLNASEKAEEISSDVNRINTLNICDTNLLLEKIMINEDVKAKHRKQLKAPVVEFRDKHGSEQSCIQISESLEEFSNPSRKNESIADNSSSIFSSEDSLLEHASKELVKVEKQLFTSLIRLTDSQTSKKNELTEEIVESLDIKNESIDLRKKGKSRCAECRKKLTISNMYECRCGLLLCSSHRYSEAHNCSYDYKTEGRKIIKKGNPLVIAPKLPKI